MFWNVLSGKGFQKNPFLQRVGRRTVLVLVCLAFVKRMARAAAAAAPPPSLWGRACHRAPRLGLQRQPRSFGTAPRPGGLLTGGKIGSGNPRQLSLATEEDRRAQEYYDSDDAFNFYKTVWGGDNIHVGLYHPVAVEQAEKLSTVIQEVDADVRALELPEDEADELRGELLSKLEGSLSHTSLSVRAASAASLEKLYAIRPPAGEGGQPMVMDMGSAYGHSARYAVKTFGAHVSCVDVSRRENERNQELNDAAGIEDGQIWINGERSFTDTGEPAGSFDLVVSQDSFLHAGQHRAQAIAEASRVLKPGGHLVFTDIMQSDDCDTAQMAAVLERIHLDDMGSPSKYRDWATAANFRFEEFVDHSGQLAVHYGAVKQVMLAEHERGTLRGKVSDAFVERMAAGLQSWVDQARAGNLSWGYLVFRKE
eukprot:SAG22_NODE_418_length_10750_cov_11.722280_2_plen_424_part_00